PPIFRLDPESTNNLRIRLNGNASLPHDRETIFYLNTRAIPASLQKELKDGSNRISGTAQFGIGTIIKMFYRPKNLPKTSEEAQKDVSFTIVSNGLSVKNNSAFYVSFAGLSIDGESLLKQGTPVMIAPYSDFIYATAKKSGKISWKTINDYGGINAYTANL
ncbi:MAG: molecular chaperone, partial [Staphylococcus sp.]|nr:molecular chaperone [Staphylococcus sp.]